MTLDKTEVHPGDTLMATVANATAESDRFQVWIAGTCCRGLPAMSPVELGDPKDGPKTVSAPQKSDYYSVVLLGTQTEPDGSPKIIVYSKEFHVTPCLAGEQGCVPAGTDTRWFYDTDAIGSVRLITDDSGGTFARYDYAPFGEPTLVEDPDNARRFAGKEFDAESGLNYFGARYLAGELGRFTSVDPVIPLQSALLDPQLWNRYVYVRDNPLRYRDPDGRCIWDLCIGEIAIATGASAATVAALEATAAATAWLLSPPGQRATRELAHSTASLMIASGQAFADSFSQMAATSGPFAREWTKLGNLKGHLTPQDLEGARRDVAGDPVLGPGGRPYQHLKEVQDAQAGLQKLIEQLKARIGSGRLSKEEFEELRQLLGDASRTLDETEELVPRP